MDVKVYFVLFLALLSNVMYPASKTTFISRIVSTDQVFELALTNYNFHAREVIWQKRLIDIKPFFQSSFSGIDNASFFLLNDRSVIDIREDGTGDVDSLWLNLISAAGTTYSSSMSVKPQRKTGGLVLTFFAYLPVCSEKLWVGLNTALVHARHRLCFQETNRLHEGILPGFENAYQALTNPAWCYAKFYCNSLNKTGLDDIQLKVGYNALSHDKNWLAPYGLLTIPTGQRSKAHHVFEPAVGSKHTSFGIGIDGGAELLNKGDRSLSWMADANYRFVFSGTERRSFDLTCNGPWSRYLQVVTPETLYDPVPGINYFTRMVRVTPGSTFQLWTALHYSSCNWQGEIGYNLWVRAHEKIKFCSCDSLCDIGILDLNGICNPPATTASTATISQGVVGNNAVVKDPNFVPLELKDLNICSAANHRAITNKLYTSVAHTWDCSCRHWYFGLNGSCEFSEYNNAFNQYAIWVNGGVLF